MYRSQGKRFNCSRSGRECTSRQPMLRISYASHLCKCLPVLLIAWDTACIQWLQFRHSQRLHDVDPASQACYSSWAMQLCTQAAAHIEDEEHLPMNSAVADRKVQTCLLQCGQACPLSRQSRSSDRPSPTSCHPVLVLHSRIQCHVSMQMVLCAANNTHAKAEQKVLPATE